MQQNQKSESGNEHLDRVFDAIEQARELTAESMPFLKGVWIPTWLLNDILMALDSIDHKLEMGRRYEKMVDDSVKEGQKMTHELVLHLLEKASKETE